MDGYFKGALLLHAFGKVVRPKEEIHGYICCPVAEVSDAVKKILRESEQFRLTELSEAEKKFSLEGRKTFRTKGEDITVWLKEETDWVTEFLMISQSKYSEDDYGKNYKNLLQLVDLIHKELESQEEDMDAYAYRMHGLGALTSEEYAEFLQLNQRIAAHEEADEFNMVMLDQERKRTLIGKAKKEIANIESGYKRRMSIEVFDIPEEKRDTKQKAVITMFLVGSCFVFIDAIFGSGGGGGFLGIIGGILAVIGVLML